MLMYLFLYQCSHQIKFILPFMEERTHESLHSFSLSVCLCVCASCPTLCDSIDCSLLGSTVHEIFQARILEWVAISFSRGSSQPRDGTRISCYLLHRLLYQDGFFTTAPPWIKKNEAVTFGTAWLDLVNIILTEVNQRQISHNTIYVEYVESKEKNDTNELICKTEIDSQL